MSLSRERHKIVTCLTQVFSIKSSSPNLRVCERENLDIIIKTKMSEAHYVPTEELVMMISCIRDEDVRMKLTVACGILKSIGAPNLFDDAVRAMVLPELANILRFPIQEEFGQQVLELSHIALDSSAKLLLRKRNMGMRSSIAMPQRVRRQNEASLGLAQEQQIKPENTLFLPNFKDEHEQLQPTLKNKVPRLNRMQEQFLIQDANQSQIQYPMKRSEVSKKLHVEKARRPSVVQNFTEFEELHPSRAGKRSQKREEIKLLPSEVREVDARKGQPYIFTWNLVEKIVTIISSPNGETEIIMEHQQNRRINRIAFKKDGTVKNEQEIPIQKPSKEKRGDRKEQQQVKKLKRTESRPK